MASTRWMQSKYIPTNPDKYHGDVTKIQARSAWERTVFSWCDSTPEVLAWGSEIEVINYFDPIKNKNRKYFMDIKMVFKRQDGLNQIVLVEIKPLRQTIKPKATKRKSEKTFQSEQSAWITNNAKWNAAKKLCAEKGWAFKIWTEEDIYGKTDTVKRLPTRKKMIRKVS